MATKWKCSNPKCGREFDTDPRAHCPYCALPDGSGWSVHPADSPLFQPQAPAEPQAPEVQ